METLFNVGEVRLASDLPRDVVNAATRGDGHPRVVLMTPVDFPTVRPRFVSFTQPEAQAAD